MSRKLRLIVVPPQHLGHELHVARSIVCDMLKQGFIEPKLGDAIVTGLSGRKFFYQSLFGRDQVFDFSILPGLSSPIRPPKTLSDYLDVDSKTFLNLPDFHNFDIINLKDYATPPTYCTYSENDEMKAIGYSIPPRYFDEDFKKISQSFDFVNYEEVLLITPVSIEIFIVIHHRYGAPIDNLLQLFKKFPKDLHKIIFTSNATDITNQLGEVNNVIVIDDLRLYASLLHDSRCKLLVSEWSGGGQISQYTMGASGVVWYYYDHYPDVYNFTMTHKIWELNAKLGTYFNCWDFKSVTDCNITHFPNYLSLLKISL